MTGLRRTAAQVLAGMTAVIGLTFGLRLVRQRLSRQRRRGPEHPPSRQARRAARSRASATTRWARGNVEVVRTFLNTSESASTQLSAWDNARRTAEAFLHSADIVQDKLATSRVRGSTSEQDALEIKLRELRADAQPQLHAASTAVAELERLQSSLKEQLTRLRVDAPRDIVAAASAVVTAHETARLPTPGALDERQARQRLDQLTSLRDDLEHLGIRPR